MSTLKRLLPLFGSLALSAALIVMPSTVWAQKATPAQAAPATDLWGQFPEARDDRYSNPASKLYAGPYGWFDVGEIRATVVNAQKTSYKIRTGLTQDGKSVIAAQAAGVLSFNFGSFELPAPGDYALADSGEPTKKTVYVEFVDLTNGQMKLWKSKSAAGNVSVQRIHGFTFISARNLRLAASEFHERATGTNPIQLGFEGALKPR